MENKYLYIDDDNHENAVEKIDGFLSENLKIDTVQHSNSWNTYSGAYPFTFRQLIRV